SLRRYSSSPSEEVGSSEAPGQALPKCGHLLEGATARRIGPWRSDSECRVQCTPSGSAKLWVGANCGAMYSFNLKSEEKFDAKKHVARVRGRVAEGDVTVACWEPGQTSPYHCHPHATEIYFCFEGGGTMRTPDETVTVTPGCFVVHPPGELHEWIT